MKNIALAFILVSLFSACTCKNQSVKPAEYASNKFYYFKVTEVPETFRYFLKDVSPCSLQNQEYICGVYAEPGWLEGRPMFLSPKYITSVAEFESLDNFQAALKFSK